MSYAKYRFDISIRFCMKIILYHFCIINTEIQYYLVCVICKTTITVFFKKILKTPLTKIV